MLPTLAVGQTSVAPEQKISVSMELAKKVFHLGEPMELKVEVTNIGQKPLLVPNHLSLFSGEMAYLEIELRDGKRLLSPRMAIINDRFSYPSKDNKSPSEIVLNSFILLPPGTTFVQRIALFTHLSALKYELKPGTYKLRGYYSSGGLFYPPSYNTLGLNEDDVKSLPFEAWHGKLATNELSFTILPGAANQ